MQIDSDGVIECCRAIDDFITALSNIKSLNMERLNTLTKYSSTCSILLKEGIMKDVQLCIERCWKN